jgi:hypothetical protein
MFFHRANLPQNLPQNSQPNFHIAVRQMQSPDKPSNPRICISDATPVKKTACVQSFQQRFGEALDLDGLGKLQFLRLPFSLGIANEFVQAHSHSLSEVHRNVFFARRDAHQPVTMAEVFVRQTEFLGAEQKCDVARTEPLANQARAIFEAPERMLQFAVAHRCGSHHERAIGNSRGHCFKLFGAGKQFRCAHRGTRFAKSRVVGIHDAQASKTEVAHGARGSAHIERVARRHQDNAQTIEIDRSSQASSFYATRTRPCDFLRFPSRSYRRAQDLSILDLSMRLTSGSGPNRIRNALLVVGVFLATIFSAGTVAAQSTTAEPAFKIAAATIPVPQELPAPVRDAISPHALVMSDAKDAYCEIWLRNSVPAVEAPDQSGGVAFGQIKTGTLIGVIKFESRVDDYRRQPIQPGVYSLRYMLQPVDGNHQGVSPDRDFLLLVPASLDQTLAELPADQLLDLSRKSSGTSHPSVWSLVPPPNNPPPAHLPAMVHQNEGDLWILYFNAPLETPATMGLILVGHSKTT